MPGHIWMRNCLIKPYWEVWSTDEGVHPNCLLYFLCGIAHAAKGLHSSSLHPHSSHTHTKCYYIESDARSARNAVHLSAKVLHQVGEWPPLGGGARHNCSTPASSWEATLLMDSMVTGGGYIWSPSLEQDFDGFLDTPSWHDVDRLTKDRDAPPLCNNGMPCGDPPAANWEQPHTYGDPPASVWGDGEGISSWAVGR